MAKGPLSTLLFVIKTHIVFRNCLLWRLWQYQLFWNSWSFNSTASLYGWNSWVTLASILDSDTFIEEQPGCNQFDKNYHLEEHIFRSTYCKTMTFRNWVMETPLFNFSLFIRGWHVKTDPEMPCITKVSLLPVSFVIKTQPRMSICLFCHFYDNINFSKLFIM